MCADPADICTRTCMTLHRKEKGSARRKHWKGCQEGARLKRRQSLGRERISGSGLDIGEMWGNAEGKN